MKIKIVVPVIKTDNTKFMPGEEEYIMSSVPAGAEVDIEYLDFGSESVESVTEQSHAIPEILCMVKKSEEEGFDGIFIDCFADPGVFPSREITRLPVVGGFAPSIALASVLGEKTAILATSDNFRKNLEKTVMASGYKDAIVSMNYLNLTVLELRNRETTLKRLVESCIEIVDRDQVDTIVLGCTVMFYLVDELRDRLQKKGCSIQIVEPRRTGLRFLAMMVDMNHTNSMNHIVSANYESIKKR